MLRSLPAAAGPYRVVFTPQTWKSVGQMPTERFDAFEQVVDDLAEKCGRLNASGARVQGPLRLSVDGLVILYERDDTARVITLIDIVHTSAASR
jgi:mRNA-degrading endonuclease RelE of RelBE toxin-antitoxin system